MKYDTKNNDKINLQNLPLVDNYENVHIIFTLEAVNAINHDLKKISLPLKW